MRKRSPNSQKYRRQSAFTLIEVLLVLVILVILGSLSASVFTSTQDQANLKAVSAQVGMIKTPIDLYRLNMNKYPEELKDLWEEPEDEDLVEKWGAPYIDEIGEDPWGNDYQYRAEGEMNPDGYDFWSDGPDGEEGTDDDIGNWKKEE
ncbi:MAG: type II secretion system major pseudopilin GspG [Planctomycetes bacterium]|nr:type II secretion system major pseudopilin GspG [Planctomycetota bacterium]